MPDSALTLIPQRVAVPNPAVEIWLMPLEVSAPHLQQCSALLSRDESVRAGRFQFGRDRRRYTVARGVLRILLGNFLGVAPAALAFNHGPYGKPCLATPPTPVHFNVSHSADFAIYAVARSCQTGVDIEWLNRDIDHEGLAQRFFSAREYAELQRIPAAARKRAFLTCWTRKEAIVKATGDGLRTPLDRIEVTVDPDAPPRLLSIPGGNTAEWTFHSVDAGSTYAATVALHWASPP